VILARYLRFLRFDLRAIINVSPER